MWDASLHEIIEVWFGVEIVRCPSVVMRRAYVLYIKQIERNLVGHFLFKIHGIVFGLVVTSDLTRVWNTCFLAWTDRSSGQGAGLKTIWHFSRSDLD